MRNKDHFLKMFKPFSDNIIFIDTEFSSLNPYKGEIMSIGLVKLSGEELYLELEYQGETDEWVKLNIVPTLNGPKISREEAIKKIKTFIGDKKPFMIAYVNQFDTIYLYKLFGVENNPCYWIPVDFASILFALGINPESYRDNENKFFRRLGIDLERYHQHNSLDDAKLLKDVYLEFLRISKQD